ncbi:MAG: hypothetical protein JWN44_4450 [Myxococcales bacterium]|nr:hypothetical protein [Myxococcales bacterium]
MLGWAALALLVVAATAPALRDPPYWDANVYVHQARFSAAHGFDLEAYRHFPDVLKPPLFASLVLGTLAGSPLAMHLAVLALALALLAGTRALVRALGGDEAAALAGGALCATAPLFVAQAGLTLSDLPMATLALWAWVALLTDRPVAWMALSAAAVLTKESGYFLCVPALVLIWLRQDRALVPTLRRAWLAAWPGFVLLGWLVVLHVVRGSALPRLNRDALGANFVLDTLIHQLVEGGRVALVPFAILALRRRQTPTLATGSARWATAAGILALPLMFPAPLPRYMLAGLPWLCALAALGLAQLSRRWLWLPLLVAVQLLGWWGASWHADGGHHLDCNLQYRRVLAAEREAVAAVAAERPRAVVAAFPLYFSFQDLPSPIPAILADASTPTESLCSADFFVDADQSAPVDEPRRRLAGTLAPWRTFGAPGYAVTVSRIACAAAPTRTPPAPPPSTN